MILIDMTWFW